MEYTDRLDAGAKYCKLLDERIKELEEKVRRIDMRIMANEKVMEYRNTH